MSYFTFPLALYPPQSSLILVQRQPLAGMATAMARSPATALLAPVYTTPWTTTHRAWRVGLWRRIVAIVRASGRIPVLPASAMLTGLWLSLASEQVSLFRVFVSSVSVWHRVVDYDQHCWSPMLQWDTSVTWGYS